MSDLFALVSPEDLDEVQADAELILCEVRQELECPAEDDRHDRGAQW